MFTSFYQDLWIGCEVDWIEVVWRFARFVFVGCVRVGWGMLGMLSSGIGS